MTESEERGDERPEEARGEAGRSLRAVVGIGASAGGVEALRNLVAALPGGTGAAYLVALHMDPGSESHLTEILSRQTDLPVEDARDGMRVAADTLYVGLPGTMLTYHGGALRVEKTADGGGGRWPLDSLFLSLAEELGPRAVAVILSGSGHHGVHGAGHVHAEGGLVIAQDPATAMQASMPRHAIHAGVADLVLAPGDIPRNLVDYLDRSDVESMEADAAVQLEPVLSLLRQRLRRDFRPYKRTTLTRRLRRRVGLTGCRDLAEYLDRLRSDQDELETLADDLTVRVTGFFRDPEAWRVIEERVIAPLVAARQNGSEIRAWVAGCATGEEAYSLAILVDEAAERAGKSFSVKIFGTDTGQDAVTVARGGLYPEAAVAGVPRERLGRYFHAEDAAFRVNEALRELVVFSHQNLLQDPPFSRMDLVSCRNLLIYLNRDVQEKAIALLRFSLIEGGVLFLGKAESVGVHGDLFEPVSKEWRIYRKVATERREPVEFPLVRSARVASAPLHDRRRLSRRRRRPMERVQEALLERYAPASVLVDQDFRILYFYGPTERFLDQPRGEPRQNLLTMARDGLRSAVRRAVRQAAKQVGPATVEARASEIGRSRPVRVVASRQADPGDADPLYLLMFEESPEEPGAAPLALRRSADDPDGALDAVERELAETREDLQSTVEELEASNEELKASNEEVTSMNEELQTSKEELQSLNEELSTVNSQLEDKVDELERATDDLRNLLSSSEIATIFLDLELRITTFSPPATRLFDILPTDVGRPLQHFKPKVADDSLLDDARHVLASLVPRSAEVEDETGRWYVRRILPYRTEDHRIEGVVVTFADVTELKRAEAELAALAAELEKRVEIRTSHVRMLQDAATIANTATTPDEAFRVALERISDFKGWAIGYVYRVVGPDRLEPSGIWHSSRDAEADAAVREELDSRPLAAGEELPGRALAAREHRWISDLAELPEPTPRYSLLRAAGLRGAIAFLVTIGEEVVVVIEFFSVDSIEPDESLLEVMAHVGTQLGRVVERARAERRLGELAMREQRRLGEDLHEGLGQQVTGLTLLARNLGQKLEAEGLPAAELARELEQGLESARDQVRRLSKGLLMMRLVDGKLAVALEELADEVCETYELACRLHADRSLIIEDERLAASLFRIAREALNNAVLHAGAGTIEIRLEREGGRIVLEVADDGRGMPPEATLSEGLGLRIMRDRAALIGGRLEIESEPETGTRIRCIVVEGGDSAIL